jgi:hypothetical protein
LVGEGDRSTNRGMETGGRNDSEADLTFWLETWILLKVSIVGIEYIYYPLVYTKIYLMTHDVLHKWGKSNQSFQLGYFDVFTNNRYFITIFIYTTYI